jgi:hypothetical protein
VRLGGNWQLIGGAWLGLIAVATVAALIPANRAARMKVVDALRHNKDAATAGLRRNRLPVPPPQGGGLDWENRISLDGRVEGRLSDSVRAALSDRFNLQGDSSTDFPSHRSLRNDFREAYVTWEPVAQTYVEAGRINVKNGSALGYNPTDFFKTRTRVDLASLDPTVLREDRLGTVLGRVPRLFEGASVALAAAPCLTVPRSLAQGPHPGMDPLFDRTNGENRFLLSGSFDATGQVTPELLLLRRDRETPAGANLSLARYQ